MIKQGLKPPSLLNMVLGGAKEPKCEKETKHMLASRFAPLDYAANHPEWLINGVMVFCLIGRSSETFYK